MLRTTQELGPSHTIDLNGTATTVRTATWNYFDDGNHVVYSASGYTTGTGPAYTFTLVNPVSITRRDADGVVLEQIEAASATTSGSLSAIIAAAGSGALAFPQSSYTKWTTTQYTDCCLAASQRVYRLIPTSGVGVSGTNYDETDYSYDPMKRLVRTASPGGTINWSVFDVQGRLTSTYVGTNDNGATFSDPTGGGASGNNMVLITTNVYDGGSAGGDGNLTHQTQQVDASTTRVTTMTYDFRDRQVTTDGEVDDFAKVYYDNLDRVIKFERYDTTSGGNLIGRSVTKFDARDRVYQTIVYAVDPATGTVGNSLTDNFWFDAAGNQIKSFPAGSSLFTKTTYDSLGRQTIQYTAYGADSTYADASSVANNTVLEQKEATYDADSNAIQATVRKRYHNAAAAQTGALQSPSVTPNARVGYVAFYPDAIGRVVNSANFGTNGGTALSRPSTCPARSDSVLVRSRTFDSAGRELTTTDSAGMVNLFGYDAADRKIMMTENYIPTSSSSSFSSSSSSSSSSSGVSTCTASDDKNRVTRWTYTADGLEATMVAENLRTTNQTTTYTYGTTLTESAVATSTLLRYVAYPDSSGGSDRIALTYNRQAQPTTRTDQRGCVHAYIYDGLARLTSDCVTTLGTNVDGAVRRLTAAFEVRGMISKLTSYDNATVGSGSIVNEVAFAYNSFGQITSDSQSHSGAVGGGTPQVQYAYTNGSTNMIRPTTLTYPNARAITIGYGTSGGINDSSSRVDNLTDGATTLVNYAYLGMRTVVQTTYPQPSTQHTLLGSSGGNSPAGDIYWGLDLFGRIIDSRWYNTGTSADVDRIKYGYDRASNRIWRQNPVATAAGASFDEHYSNDGLERLKDMQRGTLNGTNTAITSPNFAQCWTLDPTGNWRGFNESTNGSSWTLNQTRTANTVNEITGITNTASSNWVAPAYDAAGNMTTMPQPGTPTSSYGAIYDAWNRLVTITDAGNNLQKYQYDARNFRTQILTYTAGVLSETRHCYFTSGWRNIEERVDTGATAERQYIWGVRYIDDLVLRDRSSERLYAMQDANWNVTSLANTSATIQERYAYSAYGYPSYSDSSFVSRASSSFTWETLYCGNRHDRTSRLYCVRFRPYHALCGTWCQRDIRGYINGVSLYAHYGVLNYTDPSGSDIENDMEVENNSYKTLDLDKYYASYLKFWENWLGLKETESIEGNKGDVTRNPLSKDCKKRLFCIFRAISWVESKHGKVGPNFPNKDPFQSGNPKDFAWMAISQVGKGKNEATLVREGRNRPKVGWSDLPQALAKPVADATNMGGIDPTFIPLEGHKNNEFTPQMSLFWSMMWYFKSMNQSDATPKSPKIGDWNCGDCSWDRLIDGADRYNGHGAENVGQTPYKTQIKDALAFIANGQCKPGK